MMRNITLFLLTFVLLLSMSACGKDNNNNKSKEATQSAPTSGAESPEEKSTETEAEAGERIYKVGETITITNGDAVAEVTLNSFHFSDTYMEPPSLPGEESQQKTANEHFTYLIYDISVNYLGNFDKPVDFCVSYGEVKYGNTPPGNVSQKQNYVGLNAQPYASLFHYGPSLHSDPQFAFEMYTADPGTITGAYTVGDTVETDTKSPLLLTLYIQLVVYGGNNDASVFCEPFTFRLR